MSKTNNQHKFELKLDFLKAQLQEFLYHNDCAPYIQQGIRKRVEEILGDYKIDRYEQFYRAVKEVRKIWGCYSQSQQLEKIDQLVADMEDA